MSNLTDFFPSGGGGGLTPKFQEFNASGTFTPTQALIDAGGYIELFLVAGGGSEDNSSEGGCGGEVLLKKMYLTSVSNITVTIGSGGYNGGSGGNSVFLGSAAGGYDLTASGGVGTKSQELRLGSGWGGIDSSNSMTAGSGTMGYGAGGSGTSRGGGIRMGKPNSGQGASSGIQAGSGYCLIKWYE